MSNRKVFKMLILILLITTVLMMNSSFVYATELPRTDDQYMELKLVSVKDVDGKDKQIILEWWSYNLTFKGADLRFSYDETKIKPSNIDTNDYANDRSTFQFTSDFAPYMMFDSLQADNGTYRCVMSLATRENWDVETEYIKKDNTIGNYVVDTNVNGGVLIGRMSFRMFTDGDLDENTFALQSDSTSPTTGIKIAQTQTTEYTDSDQDTGVFRFSLLSNDASLKSINYDFFNYIEGEGGEKTMPTIPDEDYTELDLSKKETDSTDDVSKYKITLKEACENISLKLATTDANATVKVKSEEMDLSKTKELALNPLGGGDTIIDIEVTAQDGVTKHTYEIIVHRPYGTIKGNIIYDAIEESDNPDIVKITDLNFYQTGKFDWTELEDIFNQVYEDPYGDLDSVDKDLFAQSKEDGTYEIYVIPGNYDLQIDKRGFLDYIVTDITINESDTIDLGNITLTAGDVDRNGVISAQDIQEVLDHLDIAESSADYQECYDIVQAGAISAVSLQYCVSNIDELLTIINYRDI